MDKRITFELSRDEALVLEGFFARFEEEGRLTLRHNAEFLALSRISAQLEKLLVEPLQTDYVSLLTAARQRLEDGFEGVAPGVEGQ
jgi:hypothetical protein